MHTILGANGIIGEELAKELKLKWSSDIKLVGRKPSKVNKSDLLHQADLLHYESTLHALQNTKIAYLTVGLPYNSKVWARDWPILLDNVIKACIENNCKLVYFDNTYAYAQDAKIQNENTPFSSSGIKGIAKKQAAELMLDAITENKIDGVICRAPEFYGPGKTKSITNALIFDSIKHGKRPKVLLNDQALRTLIYTPDAGKAMALIANTPDTYGTTWHLPCDDNRMTYQEIINTVGSELGRKLDYTLLNKLLIRIISLFNANLNETRELLPRYAIDNIFESNKFKRRFPEFKTTSYHQGIKNILRENKIQ